MAMTRVARFKDKKEIMIAVQGRPVWISFEEARDLQDILGEMLDGNLIEISLGDCGCLNRKTYLGEK